MPYHIGKKMPQLMTAFIYRVIFCTAMQPKSVSVTIFFGLQILCIKTRWGRLKWITITSVAIETAIFSIQAQTINIVNQKQNNIIIRYGFFKQKLLIRRYLLMTVTQILFLDCSDAEICRDKVKEFIFCII